VSKSATLYGWRADAIDDPPLFALRLAKEDPTNPVVSQAAWDATTSTVVVTASGRAVGVRIAADCKPRIAFSHQFGPNRLVGSPTVAGGVAWMAHAPHDADYLAGIDLVTGKLVYTARLGEHVLAAPAIVDGFMYAAGFGGILFGFGPPQSQPALPARPPEGNPVARHTSWFGPRYGWRSVPGGVLATENKGKSWHAIFPLPVDRLLRASRLMGVLTTGSAPRKCLCAPRVLWTGDAGQHWHLTGAIAGSYAGGRSALFWWRGGDVSQVTPWPTRKGPLVASRVFRSASGRIAAGTFADGVFYGVVGAHDGGKGWDTAPVLVRIGGGDVTTMKLPEANGLLLVQSISVAGRTVEVVARDYGFANADAPIVKWRSLDGGQSWGEARQPG
jgi:hypothetical protein